MPLYNYSQENSVPEVPLNGSNPLNVDPPETPDFVETFNASAIGYIEEVIEYQELLQEVEETNTLGEQLVNLVCLRSLTFIFATQWHRSREHNGLVKNQHLLFFC